MFATWLVSLLVGCARKTADVAPIPPPAPHAWTLRHAAGFAVEVPEGAHVVAGADFANVYTSPDWDWQPTGVLTCIAPELLSTELAAEALTQRMAQHLDARELSLQKEFTPGVAHPNAVYSTGQAQYRKSFDVFSSLDVWLVIQHERTPTLLVCAYRPQDKFENLVPLAQRVSRMAAADEDRASGINAWIAPGNFRVPLAAGTTVRVDGRVPEAHRLVAHESERVLLFAFTVSGGGNREALIATAEALLRPWVRDIGSVKRASSDSPQPGEPLVFDGKAQASLDPRDNTFSAARLRLGLVESPGRALGVLGAIDAQTSDNAAALTALAERVDTLLRSARAE